MKKTDISKVKTLLDISVKLLNNSKDENKCTDEENEFYDELANLKEVIYNLLESEEK